MTPAQQRDFHKYLATHFRHIEKQNQAILVYLTQLLTKEQITRGNDIIKQMNTRPTADIERIKRAFTKKSE
jgi:hypothetical protein